MTTHQFTGSKRLPRIVNTIVAHGVPIGVLLYCAIAGIHGLYYVAQGMHHPDALNETTVSHLPPILGLGITGLIGVGAAIALFGILYRHQNIRVELNIEQAGWIMLTVGWLLFLYAAARYGDATLTAVIAAICVTFGGGVRVYALFLIEKDLELIVLESDLVPPEDGEATNPEGTNGL